MNHIVKWALLPLIIASLISTQLHAEESAPPINSKELKKWQLPKVTYPQDNPRQKIVEELGRQLFFDPRLTGDRSTSCAACHFPGTGWSDPLPVRAENTRSMERQVPSLINVAFQQSFFWDGRSQTLESAVELHLKELSVTLGELPDLPKAYQSIFKQAFGSETINSRSIAKAVANYLRTIVVNNSPFDRWVAGDKSAISTSSKNGYLLFTGKAGCSNCHTPPNFSDSKFHNIGLNTLDPGYFDVSGNPDQRNSFRTSPLRQVSQTPPYMHTGSKRTLMLVIEFYNHGGDRHGADNELKPLQLNEREERQLLDFLMSLTGRSGSVLIPELPPGNSY